MLAWIFLVLFLELGPCTPDPNPVSEPDLDLDPKPEPNPDLDLDPNPEPNPDPDLDTEPLKSVSDSSSIFLKTDPANFCTNI